MLAMSLDCDLPYVHMRAGWIKIFLGCAEEAEGHLSNAMRLSPRDPLLGNLARRIFTLAGLTKLWTAYGRRWRSLQITRLPISIWRQL
jgi:hypothetical protein